MNNVRSLLIISLVTIQSMQSSELSRNNQLALGIIRESSVPYEEWDGWAYEMFSGCWFNCKIGAISFEDPRVEALIKESNNVEEDKK